MSGGIEVIGVLSGLLLGALLAAVAREDVLVMVEIVVLVLIKVRLGHVGFFFQVSGKIYCVPTSFLLFVLCKVAVWTRIFQVSWFFSTFR